MTSGPKSYFICDNIPTNGRTANLFFIGCAEVSSFWLITSELANQCARKVPFTCAVYTRQGYRIFICTVKNLFDRSGRVMKNCHTLPHGLIDSLTTALIE